VTLTPAQIEFDDQGRLVSTAYGDIYFQPENSIAESEYVFLDKGGFFNAVQNGSNDLTVAELGFGTGLNFLLCLQAWQKRADKKRQLHFISFEKHPIVKADLEKIYTYWPQLSEYADALLKTYPTLTAGIHPLHFPKFGASLTLCLGDVRDLLSDMQFQSDIWFLDGFAPAKNPDMWAEKLWRPIAHNTKQDGRITTFTAAGAVKRGLQDAGFEIEKVNGYGRKRDMIVGRLAQRSASAKFDAKLLPVHTPEKPKTIAVIGAGIAGCALADALTRHGLHVTLYDWHDGPASEASGNPLAAVYPKLGAQKSAADQIYRQAFCYTEKFYRHLDGSTFDPCGVFQIDRNNETKTRHQKIAARNLSDDLVIYIETDTVSGLDLECGGLFIPRGGMISPPALCQTLLNRASETGRLKTQFNFDFNDLDQIDADIIILSDGVSISSTPQTSWIPTEIVRGQITEWTGNGATQKLKTVICHKGYITPQHNGAHCFGATFDKGETKTQTPTNKNHERNFEQLFKELPILQSDYNLSDTTGRQGNRVATPDRLPLCGPVIDPEKFKKDFTALSQDASNLFDYPPRYYDRLNILGALGSHGMTTAPWLAEILARQLSGAPVPASVPIYNAISPSRFAVRTLIKS